MRIPGLRKWLDLIREDKMFVKNQTKVACRMSGIEWRVVYFRKLPFEINNEKFSLRRVKSKKIRGHLGGNLLQSGLEVGDTWVKVVTRMEWEKSWESSAYRARRWECWVGWHTVYMTKSRGARTPRTEPRLTPQKEMYLNEFLHGFSQNFQLAWL